MSLADFGSQMGGLAHRLRARRGPMTGSGVIHHIFSSCRAVMAGSNVQRDKKNIKLLRKRGWLVLTVWECETKNVESLEVNLAQAFKKRNQFLSRATRV